MTFEKTLAWVKREVEQHLEKFFVDKRNVASRVDPHCVELVDQIADVTMRGGKRIRAYVCWLGYCAMPNVKCQMSNKIPKTVIHTMVALELFHSFALIHDDIMDQDRVRRGGPTVHEYFRTNHESRITNHAPNAKQYGISMAILAGDLALAWADEVMEEVNSNTSNTSKIAIRETQGPVALYQAMKEEVIYGQTLDIMKMHQMADISQQTINELKTAWYTVIRPLQVGASLAGASASSLKLLATFGLPVGLLFQLKDDVLDGTITPTAFEKAAQSLRAQASRSLTTLNLTQEMHSQCERLVRFVVERTF